MSLFPRVSLSLFFATVITATANAQCPMADGLDGGPCCTTVDANLPFFPKFKHTALNLCWLDCDLDAQIKCDARWSELKSLNNGKHCGRYRARLRIFDGAGVKLWRGQMFFTYSRTWHESDGGKLSFQVWRFLVNGNLKPTKAAGGSPCPVPSCAASFNGRVRFTGYVDWAQDCNNGTFHNAWMLTHGCDKFDHVAGFHRGGTFHPEYSYTFVGPGAGFVTDPIQPIEGGQGALEAVRRSILPNTGSSDTFCEFEDPISFRIDPQMEFCACGSSKGPNQFAMSDLSLDSTCGVNIATPTNPIIPGLISMGIGGWTDAAVYPGVEALRYNVGGYDYFEPCTGTTRNEVFYGVTTIRGYKATQILANGFGAGLPPLFIDQGNSIKRSDGISTTMNIPYASDHVLNLNH